MFPVLMSAPPIYDAQEIEEYRQKSAEMIEIDGRTLSRYEWTQEQRKIETAIRTQKDISNPSFSATRKALETACFQGFSLCANTS